MLENLKKLLEGASEEELQEIIDFTEVSVDQCKGFTLRCMLELQDCINEQLEKISRPEDTIYILTRDYIKKMFNLGDNMLPYAVLAIGYPASENANFFRDEFDPSRIHYDK